MSVRVSDEPASAAVIEAVANEKGDDPTELPPLGECIDPDALNELVARSKEGSTSPIDVTFSYSGCVVRVQGSKEMRAVVANIEDESS